MKQKRPVRFLIVLLVLVALTLAGCQKTKGPREAIDDYLKKAQKHRALPVDEMYNLADEEDIEHTYIRDENKIMLYRALSRLTPLYSQVLHLKYLEGFTNSETACIMKKTNRQIENLIYRAKSALREELEKEGFVYEGL